MVREALDRWCERGILALVLGMLVLGPLALGAVGELSFAVIEGLMAGVLALWVARLWLEPRPQLLWPPLCWVVLAFAAYAIARYFTADIEYVARQELFRVLVYAFLFFAILAHLRRQESAQIVAFTLIFLAMAISFYAAYQFVTNSDRVWSYIKPYPHQGSGTYICPNHLGGFLEMLVPLALAYVFIGRIRPLTRILVGYAGLVLLVGIAVTVSRGSWISTALALALFFGVLLFQRRFRIPAMVLLSVLVVGGLLFVPRSYVVRARLKALTSQTGRVNDDLRFALWRPALRMSADHLLWGVGPGHFDYRFRQYRPEEIQRSPDRTHNDYINALVDWGLAGAAIVASAWVLLGIGVRKSWRRVRSSIGDLGPTSGSNKLAFLLGGSLGLIALLCHSFVDFNFQIPANAMLAVAWIALLSAHLRFATDRYWVGVPSWAKPIASAVLIIGAVCLGVQGWRQAAEAKHLADAADAPDFSDEKIQALLQAYAVEPKNPATTYDIGEAYRTQSLVGGENSRELVLTAIPWFERAMKLNPWDGYGFLRYGMCLDRLDRQEEAGPYFCRADALDPNGYYTMANIGLHYVNLGDYAAAKPWFERSLRLKGGDNPIARNYLQIAERNLQEAATNDFTARLYAPLRRLN
jgi:O-antigen ligase